MKKTGKGLNLFALAAILLAHTTSSAQEKTASNTAFYHLVGRGAEAQLTDADGKRFIFAAVDQVHYEGMFCEKLGYSPYGRTNARRHPDRESWRQETVGRLKSWGFNALGANCCQTLRHRGLVYAYNLLIGERLCSGDPSRWISEFRNAPCTAFPDVFHPDFEAACEARAREICAALREERDLVGYFLDNELMWWGHPGGSCAEGMFEAVAALPEGRPAKNALTAFLAGRTPTPEVKLAFLAHCAERYFSVTTAAIRRHDPNHLILGCRVAGLDGVHDVVWKAMARHCDVISFNCYPWVDLASGRVYDREGGVPLDDRLKTLHRLTERPLLVSEWGFRALDAGLPCTHGTGQIVKTQKERACAAACTVRLLRSLPYLAGYSFFMWVDQPVYGFHEHNLEDSNYGLVNAEGEPYEELTSAFAREQITPPR